MLGWAELQDKRDARGLRYSLVTVLVLIVLAKLAGEDRLVGIAEWVKHRAAFLAEALALEEGERRRIAAPTAGFLAGRWMWRSLSVSSAPSLPLNRRPGGASSSVWMARPYAEAFLLERRKVCIC